MRAPQGIEWVIILAIVLLLFGAKRLPDAARGLGRSLRILKAETKGLHDEPTPAVPAGSDPAALPTATAPVVDLAEPRPEPATEPTEPGRRPTS